MRCDYSFFDNIPSIKQWLMENESKYELQRLEPVDEIKFRVVILKKIFLLFKLSLKDQFREFSLSQLIVYFTLWTIYFSLMSHQ